MTTKLCTRCQEEKPISDFGIHSNGRYRSSCRECVRISSILYRKNNPTYKDRDCYHTQSRQDYRRDYYAKNRDHELTKGKERDKVRRESRPKSCNVYFLTCQITGNLFTAKSSIAKYSKEGSQVKSRQQYQANKERHKAYCRKIYQQSRPELKVKLKLRGLGLRQCSRCKCVRDLPDFNIKSSLCPECHKEWTAKQRKTYKETENGKASVRNYRRKISETLTDGFIRRSLKHKGFSGEVLQNPELIEAQRLIIKIDRLCRTSQS